MINDYGFIETPYRRVIRELPADSKQLLGRTIREDVMDGRKTLAKAGEVVTEAVAKKLAPLGVQHVKVQPLRLDGDPSTSPLTTKTSTSSPRRTR